MRFLVGPAIVLFVTAIGALIPFTFRERMEISLGSSAVCDMLATGVRLGHINEESASCSSAQRPIHPTSTPN